MLITPEAMVNGHFHAQKPAPERLFTRALPLEQADDANDTDESDNSVGETTVSIRRCSSENQSTRCLLKLGGSERERRSSNSLCLILGCWSLCLDKDLDRLNIELCSVAASSEVDETVSRKLHLSLTQALGDRVIGGVRGVTRGS